MKLVTFTHKERTRIGELVEGTIYAVSWQDTMLSLIRRGLHPGRSYERFRLDEVKLEAPLHPGKIVAIGRNYAEHAAELGNDLPKEPIIFAKFPSSVIGPGDTVRWRTSITKEVDWEAELAVIIGRRATHVPEESALEHVFGYTVANDVSARDLQLRKDSQWTRGKSLDTFCPLGPWIVTRDEIADPQVLNIKLTVNKKVMQDSSTANMIFSVAHLISFCSAMFTLEPGDVILTGTPPGVGDGRKPPVYLTDRDVMTASVEGIGDLTNPCQTEE
jgi:2-keto-4-pentenoate hydratase/2-oxohepta-3-ene-1,7-dioic acid hydratase in catechol pathway